MESHYTKPRARRQLYWVCKCGAERDIEYLECESEKTCDECGQLNYIEQAGEAEEDHTLSGGDW